MLAAASRQMSGTLLFDGEGRIRIAVPAWTLGRVQQPAPAPRDAVSKEELEGLFGTELRRSRHFANRLTQDEIAELEHSARIRRALYSM